MVVQAVLASASFLEAVHASLVVQNEVVLPDQSVVEIDVVVVVARVEVGHHFFQCVYYQSHFHLLLFVFERFEYV